MAKKATSIIPIERIQQSIYLFRGQKVMLDKDLAGLYGIKPIVLRQQVKRNIERFPSDFMYQLTDKEVKFLLLKSIKSLILMIGYLLIKNHIGRSNEA